MADTPTQRSAPESVPKEEAAAEPDPAFERWRRKAAWVVGYGLSPEDEVKRAEMKRLEQVENEWSKCQKWKIDLMKNSPSVSIFSPFCKKQVSL
jgi:inner membrane protease ATP23